MRVLAVTVMMTTMTAVRIELAGVVAMKTMNGLAVVAHLVVVVRMTQLTCYAIS
jgi:hypothetical protein